MNSLQGGYVGRFLRVNLTDHSLAVEPTPEPLTWLGSRGWNALIGWNEVMPGTGPFDAENRLVFSAGPLVGTCAPTAGRTTVSTVMPRGYPDPIWSSASMGGYFGAELKFAGYDGIVIHGRASSPCYLLIQDDRVTLEDARDLWGKGVFSTQQILKERHGGQHQVATIGPAGENRVRFASIIHRLSNAVGNGGFGGVMGAKNLKAIAVRGTGGVGVSNPLAFLQAARDAWQLGAGGVGGIGSQVEGYPFVACTHGCSVRCGTHIAQAPGELADGPGVRMVKCVNGSLGRGSHPEYRGASVTGEKLFVPRPPGLGEPGLDLGNLIEDMGLTAWSYDTWYRYLGGLRELGINSVGGKEVRLEDPAWWREWILDVAHRRGIGDDMAEGLARFYDKHEIGPRYLADFIQSAGSRGHSWHREGRAMEPHPSPFWEYSALLYAVSTRDVTPSTHGFFFLNRLYGYPSTPKDPKEISLSFQRLAEGIYGSSRSVHPGLEHIEHVTAWHQHRAIIKDSLGLCDWVYPIVKRGFATREQLESSLKDDSAVLDGDTGIEARLYRACTGIDIDIATMERPISERIVALERCLDIRNYGRCRDVDEAVIPHYQWSEKTDSTHLSSSASEFRDLLDRYYDLRGWDRDTGAPTSQKLIELGLEDAARELWPD